MSLKLVKLDLVVHVFAVLTVYLRRLCVMMEVVADSYEELMAGTRIGKERKRKELVGLKFHRVVSAVCLLVGHTFVQRSFCLFKHITSSRCPQF